MYGHKIEARKILNNPKNNRGMFLFISLDTNGPRLGTSPYTWVVLAG
jgi:hypothetical protein